ncbi:FMRFamide receptor-like [Phymastichus coffea]|uniref:FMRFamide receptor-like n=1 Tax=Phymastichus coffea TaxID=108790 RepID=UPI00273B4B69|nr:FMRFamide receptor-like [Phymastichus coffea]
MESENASAAAPGLLLLANQSSAEAPKECDAFVSDGLLEFVIYGLLLNLVSLLGIAGNAVSMIVLSRPQMKSSINYLLIGLATCDTVLILLSVLMYGLPGIYAYTGYLFDYKFYVYPKVVRFLYPLSLIVQMGTVYVTLTVTIERYVAVCHPLQARSLCTHGRARSALLALAVLASLCNLPRFWEVGLRTERHWRRNVSVLCVASTALRRDPLYITVYVHWFYFLAYYAVPFVILAIFNVLIYRRVRKANRDLRRLSRSQRREIGLASMLLCVVVVFLVCNVLPLVTNVYENFYTNPPAWLVQTGNLLVTFNSGVNFVIYVIFGRKFKRVFLRIFCRASLDAGLDCMGRPSRADSPDFQTNDDSLVTNSSHVEMRLSARARLQQQQQQQQQRQPNGSSVYYPGLPAPARNGHNVHGTRLHEATLC